LAEVEFFWDVGSPYTYLAAAQLPALLARTGARVRYRPMLVGGLFRVAGNTMPAAVPAKALHLRTDLSRWRARLGLPMRLPPDEVAFPINTLLAMRVATAATAEGLGAEILSATMRGYWERGLDVGQPEPLSEALADAGLDPARWLEAAGRAEVKDALRATTEEAAARGAFGAPTFFVGDELFWGNDRLDFVEAALAGAPCP
jgi:2-hydroxychromene-2-carboxylate isomerase